MKKIHTTDNKRIDLKRSYVNEYMNYEWKPYGLWYSIDYAWHTWCKDSNFGGIGKYDFNLEIDETNLLKIENISDLECLPTKFTFPQSKFKTPDWNKIIKKYKGFQLLNQNILEFSYSDGLHLYDLFVGSLDCDCGCIWDLSCIKSIERINNGRKITGKDS